MIPQPIAWQSIEDTLYDWFKDQAGMEVIWGNQDSPRPSNYPYGVMTITNGPQPPANAGIDEYIFSTDLSNIGNEVKTEFGNQREMTLRLQILTGPDDSFDYQKSSRSIMNRVHTSIYAPSVQEKLNSRNISILRIENIIDLSEVQEETWIGRSSMDLIVGLTSFSFENVGYIKCTEISSPVPGTTSDINLNQKEFGDC